MDSVEEYNNKASKGSAAEFIAIAHLLRQGYHVFPSASPACPCDMIVMKDDELFRVEVKSITWHKDAVIKAPSFSWPRNDKWDLLVVVDLDSNRVFEFRNDQMPFSVVEAVRVAYGCISRVEN